MIALRQGELDGLCGVYSTINATRLITEISLDQSHQLFQEIFRMIERRKNLSTILGKGFECQRYHLPFHQFDRKTISLETVQAFPSSPEDCLGYLLEGNSRILESKEKTGGDCGSGDLGLGSLDGHQKGHPENPVFV